MTNETIKVRLKPFIPLIMVINLILNTFWNKYNIFEETCFFIGINHKGLIGIENNVGK